MKLETLIAENAKLRETVLQQAKEIAMLRICCGAAVIALDVVDAKEPTRGRCFHGKNSDGNGRQVTEVE